ncbi:hypothetical protein ACIA8G_01430 [Lentzea sp. NPDC051213]|uniref:hypothetical protein n=1 Tax=Lentzea sp. NPDC051213 TaxID=3364126 RepID=UPI0037AEEABE
MPRKTRRQRANFYIALVAVLMIFCVIAFHYENYWRAAWTGSFAVVVTCWIIAVRFPVRCAVTTRQGSSCRNPANGVLFGCSRHTWIKFRAHVGRHERVQIRSTTTTSRAEPPPRSADAAERRRSTALFWLAIIATGAGFISMTTDVIGLFG